MSVLEWVDTEVDSTAKSGDISCRASDDGFWMIRREGRPPTTGYDLNRSKAKHRCETRLMLMTGESFVTVSKPDEQIAAVSEQNEEDEFRAQLQSEALNVLNSSPAATRGEQVLQEADAIAGKDRSRDYGHPKANHDRIAKLWNAYCDINGKKALFTARDVAVMMILLKIARDANAKKFDNLVDMAGYVKCAAMIDDSDANHRNGLDGPAMFDSAKYGDQ